MSKHEWRENTPEGDIRFVTATRQAGKWKFRTRLKSEEAWTPLCVVALEDLEYLREVLWNKHQRRRVPYEHVLEVDSLIQAAERGP